MNNRSCQLILGTATFGIFGEIKMAWSWPEFPIIKLRLPTTTGNRKENVTLPSDSWSAVHGSRSDSDKSHIVQGTQQYTDTDRY